MFGLEGRGEKWPLFGLEGKRGKNKNMKWNDFHGSHQFLKILLSFQIHKIASILYENFISSLVLYPQK